MDRKRKKVPEKQASRQQPQQKAAQPRPQPAKRPEQDILNDKDREILSEVDRIIWNPSLLNKFKAGGVQVPDGQTKKKAAK